MVGDAALEEGARWKMGGSADLGPDQGETATFMPEGDGGEVLRRVCEGLVKPVPSSPWRAAVVPGDAGVGALLAEHERLAEETARLASGSTLVVAWAICFELRTRRASCAYASYVFEAVGSGWTPTSKTV